MVRQSDQQQRPCKNEAGPDSQRPPTHPLTVLSMLLLDTISDFQRRRCCSICCCSAISCCSTCPSGGDRLKGSTSVAYCCIRPPLVYLRRKLCKYVHKPRKHYTFYVHTAHIIRDVKQHHKRAGEPTATTKYTPGADSMDEGTQTAVEATVYTPMPPKM